MNDTRKISHEPSSRSEAVKDRRGAKPEGKKRSCKPLIIVVAVLLIACAGVGAYLFMTHGDDADKTDIVGQWQVKGTTVTVVFSGTEFKTSAGTYTYTIDPGKRAIVFTRDAMSGPGSYSFDSSRKVLTITQSDGKGGTKTTVFDKVSDDGSASPSVGSTTTDGDGDTD